MASAKKSFGKPAAVVGQPKRKSTAVAGQLPLDSGSGDEDDDGGVSGARFNFVEVADFEASRPDKAPSPRKTYARMLRHVSEY